ncbi:unnamed protein product, partial [marine sediment metagenome]
LDSNDSDGIYTCTDANADAGCTFAGGGTGNATLGSVTNTQANIIGGQTYIDGGDAGNTDIVIRDYDAIAVDGDDNAMLEMNCSAVATTVEECDFDIQLQTEQFGGAGGTDSALVSRLKLWSANGETELTSNTLQIDGMYTGSSQIIFTDFDAGDKFAVGNDGDPNVMLQVECSNGATGDEDCDYSVSVQETGVIDARITIDADGALALGSDDLTNPAGVSTNNITLSTGGTVTLVQRSDGGNGDAQNELVGLPKIVG